MRLKHAVLFLLGGAVAIAAITALVIWGLVADGLASD